MPVLSLGTFQIYGIFCLTYNLSLWALWYSVYGLLFILTLRLIPCCLSDTGSLYGLDNTCLLICFLLFLYCGFMCPLMDLYWIYSILHETLAKSSSWWCLCPWSIGQCCLMTIDFNKEKKNTLTVYIRSSKTKIILFSCENALSIFWSIFI